MRRKLLILAGSLVALLILIALVLPLFINANTFRPMLETYLSGALGRKVEIGGIHLSVFSGSIVVDRLSVADDPAFSASPFLTAKQLSAGVSLMPLIFSKRLDVTSLTITDPRIRLVRAASGRWNYSSLGAVSSSRPAADPPASAASMANNFSVAKFTLANGAMTVANAGSPNVEKYSNVNLSAANVSYNSNFPFHLTAATPNGGSIKLDGKAGPVNASDTALTPFQATISARQVDLAATGFIAPSAGIGGTLGFDGSLASDGRQATSAGTVQIARLRLAPNATPAGVPVRIEYATTYDLHRSVGSLSQGAVHVGRALATLAGTYNMAGPATILAMNLTGTAMPAPDLQAMFPALGMALPSGAALQSGTLDTALTFSGPVDKLVIAGNVNLANARLTGFNLGGELGTLQAFAGLANTGNDTEIQTLSAHLRIDAAGTSLQQLKLIVPPLGALNGNGTIGATGQLDCSLVANIAPNALTGAVSRLASKSRIGGLVAGALGALTGNTGAHSAAAPGSVRIPIHVTGTTAKPIFRPALGK
jgi:AsmA protein